MVLKTAFFLSLGVASAAAGDARSSDRLGCRELVFQYAGPQDSALIPQHLKAGPTGFSKQGGLDGLHGSIELPGKDFAAIRSIVESSVHPEAKDLHYVGFHRFVCTKDSRKSFIVDKDDMLRILSRIKNVFRRAGLTQPDYLSTVESAAVHPPHFESR